MKNKILFVYTNRSSFVKKDIEILSQNHVIDEWCFDAFPKWKTPLTMLKQFFFLLFNTRKYGIIITQFASYHSTLPSLAGRIFRVPVLIICGGTESAGFPSINYGNFHKKTLAWATTVSINFATHLAPKHQSLIHFKYHYDNHDFAEQGLQFFIKNFKTPYTVIENGYDATRFKCIATKKKNTFITVAAGIEMPNTIPLKGIDLVIAVAPLFMDCTFYIVGVPDAFNMNLKSTNVVCLPPLKNDELIKHFSEAEFYLQLSMSEGFPNAICEAMLCECIPIGSDVNAIPDIIADTGFLLQKRNLAMLQQVITKALICDKENLRSRARAHITNNFTIGKRARKLLKIIDALILIKK